MRRAAVERKLWRNVDRLRQVREELAVAQAQLEHFAEVADTAELEALVSESRLAEAEHRDADRSVAVMRRNRDRLRDELARLERTRDDLLDQLTGAC